MDANDPGYLSLSDLVAAAQDAGGADHHFKVIQLPYNLGMTEAFTRANQRVKDRVVPVLEAAREHAIAVSRLGVAPPGAAHAVAADDGGVRSGLTTDAQRALQFVRSTPGITAALVGMKTPAHVDENATVGTLAPMGWEQFQRLFSAAGG